MHPLTFELLAIRELESDVLGPDTLNSPQCLHQSDETLSALFLALTVSPNELDHVY